MELTSEQIRAARAALGWSASDLAKASGLARGTVQKAEANFEGFRKSSALAIRVALEDAGIEFIDRDDGARGIFMRPSSVE